MGKTKTTKTTKKTIKLNTKERTLLTCLAKHGEQSPSEIAERCFAPGKAVPARSIERAGWFARNSVRKPVALGFVEKTGRGAYRITRRGRSFLAKRA